MTCCSVEDHPGPIPKCKPAPSESLGIDLEDHGIMTFPWEKVRRSKGHQGIELTLGISLSAGEMGHHGI